MKRAPAPARAKLTYALIAGAIAFTLPTLATAQTGYGLRLCNAHLSATFICSCAGPAFEREFSEHKLESLTRLKALEAEHGKEMMRLWLLRTRTVELADSLQRLDAVATSDCAK
jgi:hypothetical protein